MVARRSFIVLGLAFLAIPTLLNAQENTQTFTPPEDIAFRTADIISEGTRMHADVYSLKSLAEKKLPTLVLCHGWGGTAAGLRHTSLTFARAGYLVVTFDFRGWGESDSRVILTGKAPREKKEGRFTAEVREVREVVDPLDQGMDLLNAIHWVHGDPQCDTEQIGLWGSSFSGGLVVYAAARDPRVKATVSQVPALDGRWSTRTPEGRRAVYGQATGRARGKISYPEPGVRAVGNLKGAPIMEKMALYAPVEDVTKAPKCAMLFILAGNEELFDNKEHGVLAHQRARGPKKIVTIEEITHYGIYGVARDRAEKLAVEWFDEHLKP